jgi:dTDP-4-amino-4,6-dideoxygalactose transaminase
MVRASGLHVLLDAANEGFLMENQTLLRSQRGQSAWVLCEVYGHPYNLEQLTTTESRAPVVRIVDMAMSVPHETLFRRLATNDFAVISFGPGKSMYAGWGAMAFAGNAALAKEVVRLRDAHLVKAKLKLRWQRAAQTFLRTLAQYPAVFTVGKRMRTRPIPGSPSAEDFTSPRDFPTSWANNRTMDAHWQMASTRVDRGLALWNLRQAARLHEQRCKLAKRYHLNLASAKVILRPPPGDAALSHYTVRVEPQLRARVQGLLFNAGINANTLWEFSRHLHPQHFPNAFRLSSQVLNLPLSPWMSPNEVDRICEVLMRCVSRASSASSQIASRL